jgi:hypothetical protein
MNSEYNGLEFESYEEGIEFQKWLFENYGQDYYMWSNETNKAREYYVLWKLETEKWSGVADEHYIWG